MEHMNNVGNICLAGAPLPSETSALNYACHYQLAAELYDYWL